MSRRSIVRHQHIEEPTVNLTPLIDVVFVILIMFILVAPLLELDRVELAEAGQSEAIAATESGPITIHVLRNNKITVNGQAITLGQLPNWLKKAKTKHPKARPQLFHDKNAHFGTYQAIKNAAEEAGFKQMDIVLKP